MDSRLFKDTVYGFGITIVEPEAHIDKINLIFKDIFSIVGFIYTYDYFGFTNNKETLKTIRDMGFTLMIKDINEEITTDPYKIDSVHIENDNYKDHSFILDIEFDETKDGNTNYVVPLLHIGINTSPDIISKLIYKLVGYDLYDSFDFILDEEEELIYLNNGEEEQ